MHALMICSFPGCDKPRRGRDYCNGHNEQRRLGRRMKPLGGCALTAEQRFMRQVRKTESCWLWTGATDRGGYGHFSVGGSQKKAHRFAYEMWAGAIPPGMHIDHVCHNRACVNPEHLRPVTMKQNNENRRGAQRTNPAKIRGVSWSTAQQKWRARVTHNNVTYHLGYFGSAEDAGEAARRLRVELFTHNDADRSVA